MTEKPSRGLLPSTRRLIIYCLTAVALVAIFAEVALVVSGKSTSEALLTVAATAVGGVAGLAVPSRDNEGD